MNRKILTNTMGETIHESIERSDDVPVRILRWTPCAIGAQGMSVSEGKYDEYVVVMSGKEERLAKTEKGHIFWWREGKFVKNDTISQHVNTITLPVSPSPSPREADNILSTESQERRVAREKLHTVEREFCKDIGILFDDQHHRHYDQWLERAVFLYSNVSELERQWENSRRVGPYRHDPYQARESLHKARLLPAFLRNNLLWLRDANYTLRHDGDDVHNQNFAGLVSYNHPRGTPDGVQMLPKTRQILEFFNVESLEEIFLKIRETIHSRKNSLRKLLKKPAEPLHDDERNEHDDLAKIEDEMRSDSLRGSNGIRGRLQRELTNELPEIERNIISVEQYRSSGADVQNVVDSVGITAQIFDDSDPLPRDRRRRYDEQIIKIVGMPIPMEFRRTLMRIFNLHKKSGVPLSPEDKAQLFEGVFGYMQLQRSRAFEIERAHIQSQLIVSFAKALVAQRECTILCEAIKQDYETAMERDKKIDEKLAERRYFSVMRKVQEVLSLYRKMDDLEVHSTLLALRASESKYGSDALQTHVDFLKSVLRISVEAFRRNPALLQKVRLSYEKCKEKHQFFFMDSEWIILQQVLNGRIDSVTLLRQICKDLQVQSQLTPSLPEGISPQIVFDKIQENKYFQTLCLGHVSGSVPIPDGHRLKINVIHEDILIPVNLTSRLKDRCLDWICTMEYPTGKKQTFSLEQLDRMARVPNIVRSLIYNSPSIDCLSEFYVLVGSAAMSANSAMAYGLNDNEKSKESARAVKVILRSVCEMYRQSGLQQHFPELKRIRDFLKSPDGAPVAEIIGDHLLKEMVLDRVDVCEKWVTTHFFTKVLPEVEHGISEDTWGKTIRYDVYPFILAIVGGIKGAKITTHLTEGLSRRLTQIGWKWTAHTFSQATSALGLGIGMYSTSELTRFAEYYGLGNIALTPEIVSYLRGSMSNSEYASTVLKNILIPAGFSFGIGMIGGPLGDFMRWHVGKQEKLPPLWHPKSFIRPDTWLFRACLKGSAACNGLERQMRNMLPNGRGFIQRSAREYWDELCEETGQEIIPQIFTMWSSQRVLKGGFDFESFAGYFVALMWMFHGKGRGSPAGIAPLGCKYEKKMVYWDGSSGQKYPLITEVKVSSTYAAGRKDGLQSLYDEIDTMLTEFTDGKAEDCKKVETPDGVVRVTYRYKGVSYEHEFRPSNVPAFIRQVYFASGHWEYRSSQRIRVSPLDAFGFTFNEDSGTCSVDRLYNEKKMPLDRYLASQQIDMTPVYDDKDNITHFILQDTLTGQRTMLHINGKN